MGCDIHAWAERKVEGRWEAIEDFPDPFGGRNYDLFAFLAGVRNEEAGIPPITAPRGMPEDHDGWWDDDGGHSASWLLVDELLSFDYDQPIEDRRIWCIDHDCPEFAYVLADEMHPPGMGKATTYRAFLGEEFFERIHALRERGADRVVFWFDN